MSRPRERDPGPASKRHSITDRLRDTWSQARQQTTASIQRRASVAGATAGKDSSNKSPPAVRLKEWLDTCNREHDHHCNAGSTAHKEEPTWRPTRLIDVVDKILVRTQPSDRYIALSYVNGTRGKGDVLEKDKIEEWEDDGVPEEELPQTMIDAIWLAKKIGIRYMWIDQLCIAQDDPSEIESHARHMAFVFSNAYLTIIAAHGDVWTGLLPLSPKRSQPPNASKTPRPGSKDHDELVLESRWMMRGWTMQEHLYSRRCVFFFEEDVTWECHCELWQGSPAAVTKAMRGANRPICAGPLPSESIFAYRHAPWPDMDEYARICMDYSSRKLSSVGDSLRAFSGVTHVLSQIWPGGFLYGMPLMFLDIALLWRPQTTIRRRVITKPPFLPSWSWMGWWFDGIPVDLVLWRAAADYIAHTTRPTAKRGQSGKRLDVPHAFRIKPTIAWSVTDRTSTAPINNAGLQYRDLRSRKGAGQALPLGWSRGREGFKHDSDETTMFKYPIPVEDPPEEGDYEPASQEVALPGPYLSFATQSAYFEIEFASTLGPRVSEKPPVAVGNIWAKGNRWAGSLRSHDGWLGVQSSNYDGEERLEFVAISTATERRGSHVFSQEQFDANVEDDLVHFVNVLWVEKIGEVWFRRGLGHILQKAWEAQPKTDVNIFLG